MVQNILRAEEMLIVSLPLGLFTQSFILEQSHMDKSKVEMKWKIKKQQD